MSNFAVEIKMVMDKSITIIKDYDEKMIYVLPREIGKAINEKCADKGADVIGDLCLNFLHFKS